MSTSELRKQKNDDQLAVEQLTAIAGNTSRRNDAERHVIDLAWRALCVDAGLPLGATDRITWRLHSMGVLDKARINYREGRAPRMDFAWPAKRICLRVMPEPSWRESREGPYRAAVAHGEDAVLRDQGWIVLRVDKSSPTLDAQLSRIVAVVKRVGPYPGEASWT